MKKFRIYFFSMGAQGSMEINAESRSNASGAAVGALKRSKILCLDRYSDGPDDGDIFENTIYLVTANIQWFNIMEVKENTNAKS